MTKENAIGEAIYLSLANHGKPIKVIHYGTKDSYWTVDDEQMPAPRPATERYTIFGIYSAGINSNNSLWVCNHQ